jgi:hypothetical protein
MHASRDTTRFAELLSLAHSEFSEGSAFPTQLPFEAHPILPSTAERSSFPAWLKPERRARFSARRLEVELTMSMHRPIAWLATMTAALLVTTTAWGQGMPVGPGVDTQLSATSGSEAFWNFQPFIDPGYFNPDFQFFAPPEVSEFGGGEAPNHGLYFTFDRTYVNVTRPRNEFSFGSGNQGDFTWGNRMEIGYMAGDPKGWQAVLWHVNGPNEYFANTEYIQEVQDNAQQATANQLTPGGLDSLNQLKMSSFELNRVWRVQEFHNGTHLEPFVGYRYMNVRDFFQRQNFSEFPFTPTANPDEFFLINSRNSVFENQMHGAQLGARMFRQRGHWMLSADVRFFAMANFQSLKVINQQSLTPNPELANVDGTFDDFVIVGGADVTRQLFYQRASQFVWGGEVRGEASYELTRDINFRVGFVFLDLGQGIGRGDLLRLNNQAVQMAGVTFGFTVNR